MTCYIVLYNIIYYIMLYDIMLYDDILYNTIVLYVLQFIIYNEYIMCLYNWYMSTGIRQPFYGDIMVNMYSQQIW